MHNSIENAQSTHAAETTISFLAASLLVLTIAASLFWSHYKLLWMDEQMELWTDSVPTARQVADIQMHYPITLDPVAYHEIEHAALRLLGSGAFGLRLPSQAGFLLMQICLFVFTRRIAGENAGAIALAFPVLTGAFVYAQEGRPYALMLGFCALAMVSWQTVTRRKLKRAVALVTLAAAVILAINVQYYGLLILVPLFAAELVRTIVNRRIDWPVWTALCAGACGTLLLLPTLGAARVFLPHRWDPAGATLDNVSRAYFMAMPHFTVDHNSPGWLMVAFGVFCLILLLGCVLNFRIWLEREILPEAVLVGSLMALPIFGFLLALVTHALEPRYLVCTVLGVSSFVAVTLSPWLHNRRGAVLAFVLVFVVILSGLAQILRARGYAEDSIASFQVAPEVKAALLASATKNLYISSPLLFTQLSQYEADPDVRSRLALLYSEAEEVRYSRTDTYALIAQHLGRFTSLKTESYESLASLPGDHLYLLAIPESFGQDWVISASARRQAKIWPAGSLAHGQVLSISFAPKPQ